MSVTNMQRALCAVSSGALRYAARTLPVECFNNKIKMVFLILMWTLIWQNGECTFNVHNSNQAVHDNNNNNTNNLYEQLEIKNMRRINDNKVVKLLYPLTNAENAKRQKNEAGAWASATKWSAVDDKQIKTMMEGDQYATINERFKTQSLEVVIGEGSELSAMERYKRADKQQEKKEQEKREFGVAPDSNKARGMKATTTTKTYNATGYKEATYPTNSMKATTINTDTKINEHQNERNNENENFKRLKVVDSGIAVKVPITPLYTKTPAKSVNVPLVAAPATGGQQISASKQTIKSYTQYTPHTAEQRQTPQKGANPTTPPMADAVDEAASMQRQLIYEFAIKHKHIPRVTFFTCRRRRPGQLNGKQMTSDKATNNFAKQEMTNLNTQTMDVLKGLHDSRKGWSEKMRSAGGVVTVKLTTDKVTTKGNIAMTADSKVADRHARKERNDANINYGHTSIAADALTDISMLPNAKSALSNGSGNVVHGAAIDTSNIATNAATAAVASDWDILIKVVHIDQLINKRSTTANSKNNNNNKYNSYAQYAKQGSMRDFRSGGYVRSADAAGAGATSGTRNAYLNANWLTQVLGDDGNRQVVVLNLACGVASRRLLEMASNKALFNSTYHWLLIEDYTFNRKTGNNDNDERDNNNNNNKSKNSDNVTSELENNELDNKKSNATGSLTDKFNQQKQAEKLQQKNTMPDTVISSGPVNPSASGAETISANTFNMNATVTNNEDDNMEIIEKYLEKINININTELILAKRHTRRIRDGGSKVNKECATDDVMSSGGCYASSSSQSDSESATNNTLQKRDYYQLYDVWSPGLQYGGQLNISEIGYFALDDGLQIALWYRKSTTITRRMDMKMARIRCLIVITNKNLTNTLEHYLTTRYDTHLDSMHRFNFALLSHVRDMYNFSFILSKTSTWGYLKNGKFDGMIGALVRKQADIGGSPIFFRIERAKVIDYTTRTWVARPCFIFRHPRSTKKDRIVFLQPFSNTIWILLGFCGIFTICFLWILTIMERRFEAVGVVKQLGQSTRAMSFKTVAAATKQQSVIGGNDELRVSCFSTRTAMRTTTMRTSGDGGGSTMHCCILEKKNIFDGQTKEQRKQKLRKLQKHNKVAEAKQEKVKRISLRHCMLGCGNACCGHTRGTDVVQKQERVSLFFESMLFYVSSICQQGLTFSTNFFSGRCIVITSLLFAFAIYQFYSASIVGTLLMEKPKTIRTLRDLIHSSLEVGIEDIPYNRDYFLRTKDPVAIEIYAKKVTSVPSIDTLTETTRENVTIQPTTEMPDAQKAKMYRDILHSHETGAHAKTNQASNWYDPEYGVNKIRRGKFAFHVDVATAYKIIADKFTEKEICDLTEIQLFPPQKMVNIVQKGSPLRKMITYGLRRITETGLTDYQRKVWHSPKPRCVKQIHPDDLRVDLQTFASALFILIFGYAASLLALSIEIIQHKLWQRYHNDEEDEQGGEEYQK